MAEEGRKGKKRNVKLKRKFKDDSMHLKEMKGKWRKIDVPNSVILDPQGGGFFSLEELVDYSDSEFSSAGQAVEQSTKTKPEQRPGSKSKRRSTASHQKKEKRVQSKVEEANGPVIESTETSASKYPANSIPENGKSPPEAQPQEEKKLGRQASNSTLLMETDMSEWNNLGVPDLIQKALSEKGFTKPTAIQAATLPIAIFNKQDVIGSSETGSGKTLAFSIPVLTLIMEAKEGISVTIENRDQKNFDKPLYSLIIAPTRELALQVKDHIVAAAKYTDIHCVAIVGGLSQQKQERLLSKCPEIVIGTPGRLYKLVSEGQAHLSKLESIKYLVIDEVDRMLQYGHFHELYELLSLISKTTMKRQTFIFSATLTIPQYHKKWSSKINHNDEVQKLIEKTGISSKARVIDQTMEHMTAEQLKQMRVVCDEEEKEVFLYYILLSHPGRTLVFVNSISYSRKISSVFSLLGKKPLQLHAGKQQRQRLKMLDRFVSQDDGLLIATDVAARGLDIPDVKTVVHFHLPQDPKVYIHRSGRTARAKKAGMSIILEGPNDFDKYKKVCSVMKLNDDVPSLDVETDFFQGIKKRVALAKAIDKQEHLSKKHAADKNWFKMTAKSMEIELDESSDSDLETSRANERGRATIVKLKNELTQLLNLPIIPKGFSGLYPTKAGKLQKVGLSQFRSLKSS